MIQQWSVQTISETSQRRERSHREKNIWILRFTIDRKKFQTGLYQAEFTGELLRILYFRAQQKEKKTKLQTPRQT